ALIMATLAFLIEIIQAFKAPQTPQVESNPGVDLRLARRRTFSIMCWITGFFLAIWLLGYNAAVPIATFLFLKFGAGERWLISLLLTALAWVFFYGLFDYALHLPFPSGLLFGWLKI
ncbi:MAG: tripartite tricarboxylate transporter TctB family protein, partial [Candidatus Binatia bacterium]